VSNKRKTSGDIATLAVDPFETQALSIKLSSNLGGEATFYICLQVGGLNYRTIGTWNQDDADKFAALVLTRLDTARDAKQNFVVLPGVWRKSA
jgi:hypothetical protein